MTQIIRIKPNKLNNKAKKSMSQRVVSATFIALYLLVLFIFGALADVVNGWSPLDHVGEVVCGFIFLFWLFPLVFICAKEICNIFFKFKHFAYIVILINMLVLIYAPTLIYFSKYYFSIPILIGNFKDSLQLTTIFTITLFSSIAFVVINSTWLIFMYRIDTFKNWFILCLITGVVSGFFVGTYFFMYVRGWTTLLFLLLIVFGMDSFSYFGGVFFGRHKMAKKISPNKTWEGFFTGLFLTTGLSLLILFFFSYIKTGNVLENIFGIQFSHTNDFVNENRAASQPAWWGWMFLIIVCLSIVSLLGDLSFSWFKRKYRIKDYGTIIPGHGGIIDRIDSHSFVLSSFFVLSFFIALIAKTVVFF